MPDKQLTFDLDGPAGSLEALYQYTDGDEAAVRAAAVVCHPHPLHGGTMHTKAVYRVARGLRRAGLPVLRFNSRGVGRSGGRYAEGEGEKDDVRAALDWLAARLPGARLWVGGFSFGAWVGVRAGSRDPRVVRLVAAGLPVKLGGFEYLGDLGERPLLVVQGEHDDIGPPDAVRTALEPLGSRARLVVVPGADHFFAGRLDDLERHVLDFAEAGLRQET